MQVLHLVSFLLLSVLYLFIWDKLYAYALHKIVNPNIFYVVKVIALTISIYISFLLFGAMEMFMFV